MELLVWGIDEKVRIAEKILKMYIPDIAIICGVDSINYEYNVNELYREYTVDDIIYLQGSGRIDGVMIAADVRYTPIMFQQLTEKNIDNIYVMPSYLYRKEKLDSVDIKRIFSRYDELKPQLYYLEFHAADNCNLNCKGCTHFSNIVKGSHFPNFRTLKRDFCRLAELFENIEYIRILGGEPFLNPDIGLIIKMVRDNFPYSKIIIVTNGILIPNLKEDIFSAIRDAGVQVTISMYPPLRGNIKCIENILTKEKVNFQFGERQNKYEVCNKFTKFLIRNGTSDKVNEHQKCRRKRCTFLYEGRIYGCAFPALVKYYNSYFDDNLKLDKGIDIYSEQNTGDVIYNKLLEPMEACCYCTDEEEFEWMQKSNNASKSDWFVES